jgi:hypothetical protein
VAGAFGIFTAAAANGATVAQTDNSTSHASAHRFDLRLVAEPQWGSVPIRNKGMIASRAVAPNTVLGIGVFKSVSRRPDSGEFRVDGKQSGSRKAAVKLIFSF